MAIKYVEDYRKDSTTNNDLTDTLTIQAAIDDLEDGDTLYFNKKVISNGVATSTPGTYALDHTIYFTSYKVNDDETVTSFTRSHITFEGLGCTIENSETFNTSDGRKFLFTLSDKQGNGISYCTINGFNFIVHNSEYRSNYTGMGPYGNVHESVYASNCTVSNCTFTAIGTGLYMCGEGNTVTNCVFDSCKVCIESDCPRRDKIHSNKFVYSTKGIDMTKPIYSKVFDNYFEQISDTSVEVSGTSPSEVSTDYITDICLSIYNNVIDSKGRSGNQRGIYISGVKDLLIKDNFISGIRYLTEDEKIALYTSEDGTFNEVKYNEDTRSTGDKNNYGIGIFVDGFVNSTDENNHRTSDRCIVTGNDVRNCRSCGIKVNLSASCMVSGNILCSNESTEFEDYGIFVGDTAGDLHVSDNALYYFADGKSIRTNKYNVQLNNNTIFDKDKKFDPFDPIRYIDTTVSDSNSSVIRIPDLPVALENNEVFGMLIPEGYGSSIVTSISYDGYSGYAYNGSNTYNFPSTDIGKYVRVRYTYYVREINGTERKTISFYLVD